MHLTLLLCSMKLPLRKSSRIFSLIQVGKTCNELVKFMKMNENECFHRQDHRFLELSYSNIQISMSSNWWFVHMTSTMSVFNILHRRSSTPIRWIFRSLAILSIGSPWHKEQTSKTPIVFVAVISYYYCSMTRSLGGNSWGENGQTSKFNRPWSRSIAVGSFNGVIPEAPWRAQGEDGKVFRWWCTRRSHFLNKSVLL